jgi:menaquinone-9 beta-reductase
VIPSFTGDGMAIALHSGVLAAEMCLDGKRPEAYQRALASQLRRGMMVATALSQAMVSRSGQRIAPAVLPLLPHPIAWIARWTRVPEAELRRSACAAGRA